MMIYKLCFLFNRTSNNQVSDSMTTIALITSVVWCIGLSDSGSTSAFSLALVISHGCIVVHSSGDFVVIFVAL